MSDYETGIQDYETRSIADIRRIESGMAKAAVILALAEGAVLSDTGQVSPGILIVGSACGIVAGVAHFARRGLEQTTVN
jgi:hypothetical protein